MPRDASLHSTYEGAKVKPEGGDRFEKALPDACFDEVMQLAIDLFAVPVALVALSDIANQVDVGPEVSISLDVAAALSLWDHADATDGDLTVVSDAQHDPRLEAHPAVTDGPRIRFFAAVALTDQAGDRIGILCVADRKPRRSFAAHPRAQLRRLASLAMDRLERQRPHVTSRAAMRMAAAMPDAIVCSDQAGAVTFWNPAAERLFGYARAEILGRPLVTLVIPELRKRHREVMARRFSQGEAAPTRPIEVVGLRQDGTRVPIEVSLAIWRDGDTLKAGSIVRDLSERASAQERVRDLTYFDGLTGLSNRAQFLERVDEALSLATPYTVLKIGLDQFKAVNGTLGMAVGDRVLVSAAERTQKAAGPGATVARLGADEFGVLLSGEDATDRSVVLARNLIERLGEPYLVGASLCHLGASIGILHHTDPGTGATDADSVLRRALLALQHAKMSGGRRFAVFQPQLGRVAEERRRIEDELRGALGRNEFEIHFQPQVTLSDECLIGAEALLRWRHPQHGMLSPAIFLQVLENSEMAVPVGCWIIREACAFAARMLETGAALRVGVNLFAAQMRDDTLYEVVVDALTASKLPPHLFELEITETTVLGLDDAAIAPLNRLRELGVGIAFDDYGTGYASLSLLKRYPLSRLKIDREFVRDLRTDPDDAAIVKAVIALGASLDLEVIAEGIETAEQATALASFGCQEAQGYLFGKPMPAAEFSSRFAPRPALEVA